MERIRLILVLFAALVVASFSTLLRADSPAGAALLSRRAPHLLAVFIGGMDSDPTPEQIAGSAPRQQGNSGLFQLMGDVQQERVVAEYFNWNGTRAGTLNSPQPPRSPTIAEFIREHLQRHAQDRVALVGNSWGGHTALEVAQDLFRHETPNAVALVVFLDASSAGRAQAPPKELPMNLNRVVHFHTRNVFVWRTLPRDRRLETIDLGNPTTGYMREGRPAYNAPFDFQAHVAAEWDERIHADIRRRLLDLVPPEE
jgi:pimeloyl-ACP methyl ester carboxylesterase